MKVAIHRSPLPAPGVDGRLAAFLHGDYALVETLEIDVPERVAGIVKSGDMIEAGSRTYTFDGAFIDLTDAIERRISEMFQVA